MRHRIATAAVALCAAGGVAAPVAQGKPTKKKCTKLAASYQKTYPLPPFSAGLQANKNWHKAAKKYLKNKGCAGKNLPTGG